MKLSPEVLDETEFLQLTIPIWNVFGQAVEGELKNIQLNQKLAYPHFWFAWAAFKPETNIYPES